METSVSRRRPLLRRIGMFAGVGLLLFYGGIGWLFSSKIQNDAFEVEGPGEPTYEVQVLDLQDDKIVLSLGSGNHHLEEPGIRGVAWPGGYGQVGTIDGSTGDAVTRQYISLGVLFGEVVLEDAGGGCPSERSVGSVVIVEVDEPVVGGSALGF